MSNWSCQNVLCKKTYENSLNSFFFNKHNKRIWRIINRQRSRINLVQFLLINYYLFTNIFNTLFKQKNIFGTKHYKKNTTTNSWLNGYGEFIGKQSMKVGNSVINGRCYIYKNFGVIREIHHKFRYI